MNADGIQIVRVSKEDYERVMAIIPPEEVYEGTDYLSDYLDMYLRMPNVECYAVEIDGKFVSFTVFIVVDNGKTLVPRAARTHKEYLGRKMNDMPGVHFIKTSKLSRSLVYQTGTGGTHVDGLLRRIKDGRLRKVLESDFRTYSRSRFHSFMNQLERTGRTGSDTKLLQESDLIKVFSNTDLCQRLFPEGRLIVDWVPYRLMESNVSLIMSPRATVVGSRLNDPNLTLLTFVNYFRAPKGFICNLDVYGHISQLLVEHLYVHFNNIPVSMSENIFIRCFGKIGTDWNFVTSLMKNLSLIEQTIWGTGLLCYEKNIFGLQGSSKL